MMPAMAGRPNGNGSPGGRGVRRGKKVAEVLAREIIKDAQRRELPPGTRLPPESEMVERFGVGRGSLREALRLLEVQGLLTIRPGPGGGPILNAVSSRDFGRMSTLFFMAEGATYQEVIDARLPMTAMMARLAAERRPEGVEETLLATIMETRKGVDLEHQAWALHASEFYVQLGICSGNRIVALFCAALMNIYLEHLPAMRFDEKHRENIVRVQTRIAKAIGAGKASTAERITLEHLTRFAEEVREANPTFLDDVVDWE